MFISNTDEGVVLTIPGEVAGPVRFAMEGYKRLMTAGPDTGIEGTFKLHLEGVGDGGALADKAWLEQELPGVPRRAGEVMSRLFEEVARLMNGMPDTADQVLEAMFGESGTNGGGPGSSDKGPAGEKPRSTEGQKAGPGKKKGKGATSKAKKGGKRR